MKWINILKSMSLDDKIISKKPDNFDIDGWYVRLKEGQGRRTHSPGLVKWSVLFKNGRQ